MTETLVITGGSKGIGLTVAKTFKARGARVISISRTPCPLEGVQSLIADLASPEGIDALGAELASAIPEPTRVVMVHNAALHSSDATNRVDLRIVRAVLEVALVAPMALNQALLPKMAAGSSILYMGSTLSEKAVSGVLSYVVSKHGIVGLMRATCQDLLGKGIHTACICPGFTDTEMLREHLGHDPEALRAVTAMTSYGRLIDPAEIAGVIAFAADNPVLNGSVIHANLGQRQS